MKWEVVGYDADGDGNFTMEEKPDWLTGLSKTSGNGGTYFDAGTATLRPDIKDLLAERNKELKEATPKGEFGDAYNLFPQVQPQSRTPPTAMLSLPRDTTKSP